MKTIVFIAFIITTILAFIGAIATVEWLFTLPEKLKKRKGEQPPIKPGDILLRGYDYENPYIRENGVYETVTDVLKSDVSGDYFFKSYSSDKEGFPKQHQSDFVSSHCEDGDKYYEDGWVIVNHIIEDELNERKLK